MICSLDEVVKVDGWIISDQGSFRYTDAGNERQRHRVHGEKCDKSFKEKGNADEANATNEGGLRIQRLTMYHHQHGKQNRRTIAQFRLQRRLYLKDGTSTSPRMLALLRDESMASWVSRSGWDVIDNRQSLQTTGIAQEGDKVDGAVSMNSTT